MSLEIGINHPSALCATYENVYLDMWWDGATEHVLSSVREHRLEFMRRTQGPLYSCAIVYAAKMRTVPKEVRSELEKILQDGKDRFVGDAVIITQAGPLLTGAIRMLMLGIRLVARSQHTMEFFSSTQDAINWVAPLAKVESKGLLLAINEATAAHRL